MQREFRSRSKAAIAAAVLVLISSHPLWAEEKYDSRQFTTCVEVRTLLEKAGPRGVLFRGRVDRTYDQRYCYLKDTGSEVISFTDSVHIKDKACIVGFVCFAGSER